MKGGWAGKGVPSPPLFTPRMRTGELMGHLPHASGCKWCNYRSKYEPQLSAPPATLAGCPSDQARGSSLGFGEKVEVSTGQPSWRELQGSKASLCSLSLFLASLWGLQGEGAGPEQKVGSLTNTGKILSCSPTFYTVGPAPCQKLLRLSQLNTSPCPVTSRSSSEQGGANSPWVTHAGHPPTRSILPSGASSLPGESNMGAPRQGLPMKAARSPGRLRGFSPSLSL